MTQSLNLLVAFVSVMFACVLGLVPIQVQAQTGSLSGSVVGAASNYNLTALGTSDWAHWRGTFIHKMSGGTQISNVSQIGGGSYGTWQSSLHTRHVSWTDGTPTATGMNDEVYIWSNGTANSGWTFTAPADTTLRTLHVINGGPSNAIVKIIAHLSDGSTADYTSTSTGSAQFTNDYAFTYKAASASQKLMITVVHTNSGSQSSDLFAAWLTTTGGGTQQPTATLSANPASIAAGGSSTLTWGSTNATSCTGNGFTTTGTSGTATVSPTATQTYNIVCTGPGGTANASATVTVGTVLSPTATLSANPTSISSGQSSTLTWGSTHSTSCAGTGFPTGNAISGAVTVTPTTTTTYSVNCS
jgi:hypothetical protein